MLMAAFVALAAGIVVENAKAKPSCPAGACIAQHAGQASTR
jgi:hypothetical protein